jgi:glycosyltransferase involved in cell wall biosynthesis
MKISVIVPVRNEEHSIRELLDSLLTQTRRPDEIVITDGGSTDSTREIITDYIRNQAPIRLICATAALPGRGRNLAAAEAKCEWLGFIDAGIRPAKDWLEVLASRPESDDKLDVVYGSWEPVTDTFFKECAAITYLPPPASVNGITTRARSIASSLMRRDVWRGVGGFPESLRSGEDLIFMNRVESAGFIFVFEPAAVVYWNIEPTFTATFKRFVAYSRSNIRAGLWRQWQSSIISRYLILVLLFLPAIVLGLPWLWFPFLLWILMLVSRGAVAIRRNRSHYPATIARNLKRLLVITPLLAVLDAAAIIGSVVWLMKDSFRWRGEEIAEVSDGA